MNDEIESPRVWTKVVGSAALGAAAMFVLDPDKGRRRRALARDKARWIARRTGEVVDAAAHDVNGRWRGVRARAMRLRREIATADDDVLRDRIRARLGHVVSHPHAIHVDARDGRVTLAGTILASEETALVEATRAVPGVTAVDTVLERHETAERIAPLLGGPARHRSRSEEWQDRWTPAARVGAVGGGALLALRGLRRGGFSGFLMTVLGAALATRGAMNAPLSRLARVSRPSAIELHKTIDVAAPPDAVFASWTRYENFPEFMSHVKSVRDLGDGRSHWIVEGPGGKIVEWDATITRMVAARLVAWRSAPDAIVDHTGWVRFDPADGGGTRITVHLSYESFGELGRGLDAVVGRDPTRQLDDDLVQMKRLIESGRAPRDAGGRLQESSLEEPQLLVPPSPTPHSPGPTMSGAAGG